ncbi:YkvA family protein [Lentzea sp. DG1S-22]|uniref:YkvA family protein n=1 Tax=Lentzea sp. DG1S-22 TaxID=3108822 RepID=UPI002E793681|nr:YkvA family protein [Lentzea sp. DG1S-22]WVH81266.1 YkvA family protein [Lentzea sp. DG1S-22]
MVVFGSLISLSGLLILLLRDAPLGGLSPAVAGWVMIPLGLVFVVLGVLRHRRKRAQGAPGPVGNPVQRLKALPRLWRTWRSGKYPELPRSQVVMWAVALVYLVSPIDVLPEFLPLIGVTDDAGVLVWLLSSLSVASGSYLRWEKNHDDPARGIEAG